MCEAPQIPQGRPLSPCQAKPGEFVGMDVDVGNVVTVVHRLHAGFAADVQPGAKRRGKRIAEDVPEGRVVERLDTRLMDDGRSRSRGERQLCPGDHRQASKSVGVLVHG